jgi:type IV secretory pathway VirJ component
MVSLLKNKLFIVGAALAIIAAGLIYRGLHKEYKVTPDHITDERISLSKNEKNNINEKLHVLHTEKPEKGLLIYIADQPHVKQTTEYARQFASLSYYVAVVDNESLLSSPTNTTEQCLNIAQKLIELSAQLKSHYKLDDDELPILVGTEAGAATVYAALAQAEPHKFHAAVSINLTPQLKDRTQLCQQDAFSVAENQALKLTSVKRLPTSFYVFQDQDTSSEFVKFTEKVGNVKLTIASDKKQNAQAEAIQILQWLDPRLADQISSDASDSDLPLIEVPADEQPSSTNSTTSESLAIIITGDGGWAEIDKNVAKILADKGIPTVALDSLSYFWKARTPEQTAQDIETIISQYLEKWNKKNVILIGYSFGADVLPFVANNLTPEAQHKISLIALLGMGKTAAFEFRLSSWMNADTNPNRLPLLPEITKMKWANSICIYGVDDEAANCLPTAELGVKIISMSGDHHFDEKYDELVQHIMENEKPAH